MENQKLLYSYFLLFTLTLFLSSDIVKAKDRQHHLNQPAYPPCPHQAQLQPTHIQGSPFFQLTLGSQGVPLLQQQMQVNGQIVTQQQLQQQHQTGAVNNYQQLSQQQQMQQEYNRLKPAGAVVIQGVQKETKTSINGIKNTNSLTEQHQNSYCPVEITQYLQATKGILEEGSFSDKTIENKTQVCGGVYNSANGTKSTTALGSMANLITRESALNQVANSQMMFMRGSMGGALQQNVQGLIGLNTAIGVNSQTIQNNSNSNRQQNPNPLINKSSKAQMYEKMMLQQDKKNFYISGANSNAAQQNTQNVTILFKNSSNSQNGNAMQSIHQQINNASTQNKVYNNQLANTVKSATNGNALSSPRAIEARIGTSENQGSNLISEKGGPYYSSNLTSQQADQDQEKHAQSIDSKNRIRLRSNVNEKNNQDQANDQFLGGGYSQNDQSNEIFNGSQNLQMKQQYLQQQYFSVYQQQDNTNNKEDNDTNNADYHKKAISQSEDPHQLAFTPQITSSNSNKRQHSQQQRSYTKPVLITTQSQQQTMTQQQQQQQFFSRRTGSQKEGGTILPPSTGYPIYYNNQTAQQNQYYNSNQIAGNDTYLSLDPNSTSNGQNFNQSSPVNGSQIQKHINHMDITPQVHKINQLESDNPQNQNTFQNTYQNMKSTDQLQKKDSNASNSNTPQKNQNHHNNLIKDDDEQQKLLQQQQQQLIQQSNNQQQLQAPQQQQEQPLKIPVICGFHKRVLLLTSNIGAPAMTNGGPNSAMVGPNGALTGPQSMAQSRRIRNKNPNCNHNNNFVFYQPCYNNVKYDDSYKKKEEVLRKVFFKECAKEEEKRATNQQAQGTANSNSAAQGPPPSKISLNDPTAHLKIIEDYLSQSLFLDYEQYREGSLKQASEMNYISGKSLLQELGLDQAFVAHKAFLLALIKAGKIINENMFKVLHEFKSSAKEFDNECIYCKYSQYALRESSKVLKTNTNKLTESEQQPITSPLSSQQPINLGSTEQSTEPSDVRIEHLVKMFSSQLFKRSFINTSLMIIQKKMNEKYLIKQKTQTAGATGPNNMLVPDKDIIQKNIEKKKLSSKEANKKINQNNQSMNGGQVSSLEQLASQIQKLSKNLANPKDKEKYLELKEKYYKEFLSKINQSNAIQIQFPKASIPPYKYYIGKGNNSMLVRTCLKQRFWWSMGDFDDWDEYNFLWTQWKSNKILACIKSHSEVSAQNDVRSGLASGGGVGGSDSLLSTQLTVTDKDSNSSAETLLATPTKRKRASTLPMTVINSQQHANNPARKLNSNSISNSASKNINTAKQGGKENNGAVAVVQGEEGKVSLSSHNSIICNHMENNFHLSNKKAIYYNMKVYYEAIGQEWYNVLPLTFHIKEGVNDKEFAKFTEIFKGNEAGQYANILEKMGKSVWIVKPGENTNRGCGINVCRDLQPIKDIITNTMVNGQKRSYIIQKYIEKPMLYKQRKFDIRCYTLLTSVNGNLQGYWYNEGYFRTSSKEFNLKNVTNRLIHLTNDAVQKKSDDYGKFEAGNKLSYLDFQKYLDSQEIKLNIVKEIVPQLKRIATDTIKAVSRKIDPHRRHCSFEIFGYDFMIDEDFKPWLIEVNTNPCFELSSPYLARLIPTMVENAVKIAIDPLYPPPPWPNSKKQYIPDAMENKFEIVFNEMTDGAELKNLPIDDTMNGIIEEEELEDEGSDEEEEEAT